MNFSSIDSIIHDWSFRNNIPLSTKYQNVEIRSFQIVGSRGQAQIWIEENGDFIVNVWDYKKKKKAFTVNTITLNARLDESLRIAREWCE